LIQEPNKNIYLDNNATTKVDDRVIAEILPFMTELFLNPSSRYVQVNEITKKIVEEKSRISNYLGVDNENEIVFTSGATESINLSISSLSELLSNKGKHIITSPTEHKAMLDILGSLAKVGYEIEYLSVDADGLIDVLELEQKIRQDTIIVSIMFCNNETGVIQPIKQIGEIAKDKNVAFFSDATQAFGKLYLDASYFGIDILCFSAHKFHGPKGVGGIFCNSALISTKIGNKLFDKFIKMIKIAGTTNVPGIIGLGKALEISVSDMDLNLTHITELRDRFEAQILKNCSGVTVNGNSKNRIYNTINLCFKNRDVEPILNGYLGVLASNGSACNSFSEKPSHVLKSMGLSDEEANSSIRFSFSKYNTSEEVEKASDIIIKYFRNLE
jgi:cysteine desulfurase